LQKRLPVLERAGGRWAKTLSYDVLHPGKINGYHLHWSGGEQQKKQDGLVEVLQVFRFCRRRAIHLDINCDSQKPALI